MEIPTWNHRWIVTFAISHGDSGQYVAVHVMTHSQEEVDNVQTEALRRLETSFGVDSDNCMVMSTARVADFTPPQVKTRIQEELIKSLDESPLTFPVPQNWISPEWFNRVIPTPKEFKLQYPVSELPTGIVFNSLERPPNVEIKDDDKE